MLKLTLFDENFKNILGILFDQLKINFFAIDKNGYYITRNATLTGIVGETDRADKVDEKAWHSCLDIMQNGKHHVAEEEYNGKWFLSCKAPLYENGDIVGVIGVAVDITEKKQAEIAKSEFIENMSHDLRTPFTGILSLTEYLHGSEQEPVKKELLGDVLTSGKRLLELLNQVLELSKKGSHPVIANEFSLPSIVNESVDLVHAEAKHKGLDITVSCPEIMVNSDRIRLSRILINLLGNAIKYTKNGFINVEVLHQSPLKIKITDTGEGIPEEKLESIFERFTKVNPSYTQKYFSGAGIGLHLARQYARDLGGDITVESKLGKGSCFTLILNSL